MLHSSVILPARTLYEYTAECNDGEETDHHVYKAHIGEISLSAHHGKVRNRNHRKCVGHVHRNVFANSITLTPGTISVEVIGDVFTVHGLESSFADGLDDWVVLKFLMKIERKLGYDSRNA